MTRHYLYYATAIVLALSLSACSPEGKAALKENVDAAGQNLNQAGKNTAAVAGKLADQARENLYKTSYKIQEWAMTEPEVKQPSVIAQRYCYQSFHDILCYRAPMPGAEHRLVAYQGTYAEPPPQPTMQLLPTKAYDPSMQPASRVANARPVFIGLPPEVKADAMPAEPQPLPANIPLEQIPEQMPNPTMVPQL
jgi:hypothetical protein